jgi:hypothetical protein
MPEERPVADIRPVRAVLDREILVSSLEREGDEGFFEQFLCAANAAIDFRHRDLPWSGNIDKRLAL